MPARHATSACDDAFCLAACLTGSSSLTAFWDEAAEAPADEQALKAAPVWEVMTAADMPTTRPTRAAVWFKLAAATLFRCGFWSAT